MAKRPHEEHIGETLGPFGKYPDLTVCKNCTIYSPCNFGDGCIFIDCTFSLYFYIFTTMGSGCILENCTLNGVVVPHDALLKSPNIGLAVVNSSHIDVPPRATGGQEKVTVEKWERCGTNLDSNNKDVTKQGHLKGYTTSKATVEGGCTKNQDL